jgi:hypothetical protein
VRVNSIIALSAHQLILVLVVQALSIWSKINVHHALVTSITVWNAQQSTLVLAVLTSIFWMIKINVYTAHKSSMGVLNAMLDQFVPSVPLKHMY